MNDKRTQTYLNIINQLLSCNEGDETEILDENQELVDQGLVTELLKVSESLREQGDLNNGNRLMNITDFIITGLSYFEREATYLNFLREVLEKIADDPNPQLIYPFLEQNLDKLDENLIQVLNNQAKNDLSEISSVDPETAQSIASSIFKFSQLIQEFPLNIANNLEIARTGYEIILSIFTFEAFPEYWASTQNNLGIVYRQRIRGNLADNLEKAIAAYTEALKVCTFERYPQDWAGTQLNLSHAYRNRRVGDKAENIEQAIAYAKKALKVFNVEQFPEQYGMVQNALANAYSDRMRGDKAENIETALTACQEASKVFTFDASPEYWATTQNNLGNAYCERIRGDKAENVEKGIAAYTEALQVYTLEIFPYKWADTQHNLGNAYRNRIRGDKAENVEKAIAAYTEALQVYTFDDFRYEWARTKNNLADAYRQRIRGDKAKNMEKALTCAKEALQVYRFDTSPQDWAGTQLNLGNAYNDRIRGDRAENLEQGIIAYTEALKVYQFDTFPHQWATAKSNLANGYVDRIKGDKAENVEKAIAAYLEALKVYTFERYPQDWARTKNNLADAYFKRIKGDKTENLEQSITALVESLKVRTFGTFPYQWATTKNNLAAVYRERIKGDKAENMEQSITALVEALRVFTFDRFPYQWAAAQTNLGNAYFDRIIGKKARNIDRALAAYTEALKVYTFNTIPYQWATTQNNLGNAYHNRIRGTKAENLEQAIKFYKNALTVYTKEYEPLSCLLTARNLGNLYYMEKQWQPATEVYHIAIEAVENARLEALNPQTRRETLSNAIDVFARMVQAHLNLNQPDKALEYIERSKTRNLVELMTQKNLQPQNVEQEIIDKLNELRQKLVDEQIRLQNQSIKQNLISNENLNPYITDYSHLQEYKQELDHFIENEITPFDPTFCLTQKVKPLPFSEIKSLTDQEICLLQWYITVDKVLAFIVSADHNIKVWESSEDDRNNLINYAVHYLETYPSEKDHKEWINQLPSFLENFAKLLHIHDIVSLIPNTCKRLIIIPHWFLHILPIHAFPLDENYILQDKYDIQYAPSCQLLKITKQRQLNELTNLFAIQNPTEDLTFTDLEVNILSTLFNQSEIVAKDQATKDTITAHLNSSDSHCHHFSCHGGFNPNNPFESFLLLANNETLNLGEIFELNFKKSRLVVLSACETGLIDLNSISDEYIGLPSGFLFAGSPSVISSLWIVSDVSTSFLMIKFYEILLDKTQNISVPIALKTAQNWLRNLTVEEFDKNLEQSIFKQALNHLQQKLSPGDFFELEDAIAVTQNRIKKLSPNDKPFENPFYWAAFTAAGI